MTEQQNIQIQPLKLRRSSENYKVNVQLISQESYEEDPEIQDQKVALKKSLLQSPQTQKQKAFTIRTTKKNQHNQLKLPNVESQNKLRPNNFPKDWRYVNKYKKAKSEKKLNKSKSLKTEEISRDIIKHPLKYKVVRQMFDCKLGDIYNLNKSQVDFIQQENMKIKGDMYLREALQKIKRIKEQTKLPSKLVEPQKKRVKSSSSKNNLSKLIEIEEAKNKKVLRKVKNHLTKGESGFLAHLDSSAQVDRAFVSFLKTKIKRAQLNCKN